MQKFKKRFRTIQKQSNLYFQHYITNEAFRVPKGDLTTISVFRINHIMWTADTQLEVKARCLKTSTCSTYEENYL